MKKRNTTQQRSRQGFTLLEILIAMFIFAAVITIIFAAYSGTFRNIEVAESQTDLYRMGRTALERIMEDLESVYISERVGNPDLQKSQGDVLEPVPFVGENTEIEGRSADTLLFPSRGHLVFTNDDEAAGTAEIFYYVKKSEEDESFVLHRSDRLEFKEGPEKGTGGLVLCEGLYSVNFTYFDTRGEAYDGWDSRDGPLKDKVPAMVSIMLEFVNESDPETPLKFMTAIALPLARNDDGKDS